MRYALLYALLHPVLCPVLHPVLYARTHARTHACTHARTHARTQARTNAGLLAYLYTHVYPHVPHTGTEGGGTDWSDLSWTGALIKLLDYMKKVRLCLIPLCTLLVEPNSTSLTDMHYLCSRIKARTHARTHMSTHTHAREGISVHCAPRNRLGGAQRQVCFGMWLTCVLTRVLTHVC